jgi:hypothetical protein
MYRLFEDGFHNNQQSTIREMIDTGSTSSSPIRYLNNDTACSAYMATYGNCKEETRAIWALEDLAA